MYKFCNGDLNKFILLLRKCVCPYEDMYKWEKFGKTRIPPKEAYSELNLEGISDADYAHAQKVWEVFGIKIAASIMTCLLKVIHYCLPMCLKTLKISVMKYMNLILYILCVHLDYHDNPA